MQNPTVENGEFKFRAPEVAEGEGAVEGKTRISSRRLYRGMYTSILEGHALKRAFKYI